jgi:hypothetical protein
VVKNDEQCRQEGVEIGLAIKKQSPLKPPFVMELANGYNGYRPTRKEVVLQIDRHISISSSDPGDQIVMARQRGTPYWLAALFLLFGFVGSDCTYANGKRERHIVCFVA